jgi:predicted dehydrogenase
VAVKRKKKAAQGKSAKGRSANRKSAGRTPARQIRYAVVGLGHIAQVAVLPGFARASNSKLAALVSSDEQKLRKLGRKYRVPGYSYDQLEDCLKDCEIDAVYIATPNHLHCELVVRAANAGVHVLCEKPMATSEQECGQMLQAAEQSQVKLMIAYRLHFEAANLEAVEIVQSGRIGEPRVFDSVFSQQVEGGNIRLQEETGGGTLWDMGIYCINAARYLFRSEPIEVIGMTASGKDKRFAECEEVASAILRFPEGRIATLTASFGAADTDSYRVVGTKGDLRVEPGYEYVGELKHYLTVKGKTRERTFAARDQFAAELVYFSNCILQDRQPEPSGLEGLIDVRIIDAIYRSARSGQPVQLEPVLRQRRPSRKQSIQRPPHGEPELVNVASPGG